MSEQTPDTNSSLADGQDPSMEDILASIRKIIAEDDKQGEIETEAVVTEAPIEAAQDDISQGDITSLAHNETLDLNILAEEEGLSDPDIDALLGDMGDLTVAEDSVPPLAPVKAVQTTLAESDDVELDDILSLDMPLDEDDISLEKTTAMDETLDLTLEAPIELEDELTDMLEPAADVDTDIVSRTLASDNSEGSSQKLGFMDGAMAALGLGGAAVAAKAAANEAVEPPKDDLSLMLDNMLEDSEPMESDMTADADQNSDPVEDLLAEIQDEDFDVATDSDMSTGSSEEPTLDATPETDSDMDLVKSLMADLTEEPLYDEEHDEEQGEDPAEAAAIAETVDIDADDESGDVMDEILSMTLDDETKLSEELEIPDTSFSEEAASEPMSLKDIAAAAEADAQNSETGLGAGLTAAAGFGVVGTALAATQDDAAEIEPESAGEDLAAAELTEEPEIIEPEIIHPIETPTEETPDMATTSRKRAKTSDAIIDEVTETATAGAFASLTNVVEEKATTAERGDRIGDLVMEALQPMLKEWLDANLKGIVERAVTKEVKRISSGK